MISHKDETVVRILSNAITRLDDYIIVHCYGNERAALNLFMESKKKRLKRNTSSDLQDFD